MVEVKTMKSGDVRRNWRDVLDIVFSKEASIVVERHGKPMAVVVGYKHWQELHTSIAEATNADSD